MAVSLDFSLAGKVAIVTGAASGIGAAIAQAFAAKGAHVALFDLNTGKARQIADTLPGEARVFSCDVTDPDSISSAVTGAAETMGSIDILVNSAGIVDLSFGSLFLAFIFGFSVDIFYGILDRLARTAGDAVSQIGSGSRSG